jgi:hypothetical protein
MLASLHVYTYRSYYYQPDSPLDLLFLTMAAYLIRSGAPAPWLHLLAALGSLNRETFGIVAALQLVHGGFGWASFRRACALGLIWLSVQALLRLWFGMRPSFPYERSLLENVSEAHWSLFLFALLWVVPLAGYRRVPVGLRWGLPLFVVPLVLSNVLFGKLEETRLFLPLGIVLIPSTLLVLVEDRGQATHEHVGASDRSHAHEEAGN